MALSTTCIPGVISIQTLFSQAIGTYEGGVIFTPKPTNPDGSAYDFTSATSFNLFADNGQQPGSQSYLYETVVVSSDETIGTPTARLYMSNVNQAALFGPLNQGLPTPGGRLSLQATDGTNTLLVASGNWNQKTIA